MHIYHVASGAPVATILRPARTPKGTEVRSKYPPAEPGALGLEPLKAAIGVANAAPRM